MPLPSRECRDAVALELLAGVVGDGSSFATDPLEVLLKGDGVEPDPKHRAG